MAITETKIVFPEHLNQAEYKNRKVTFHILKPPSMIEGVANVNKKIKEKYTSAERAIGNMMNSEPIVDNGDYIRNLETNYRNLVETHTDFTIVLPLPNSLRDNQGHEWSAEKGIIGTVGDSLMNTTGGDIAGALKGIPFVGNIANILTKATGTAKLNVDKALGNLSNEAGFRKPLVDPGYFQNYSGSKPRSWGMTFDLIPNNAKEANDMIFAIMKLKEYSSPEVSIGGISMLAPRFFDIEIGNELIQMMSNLRGVVLTNMEVNYGADGNMQMYPDGTPKYIQLTLSFAERTMSYAGMYRANKQGSGTVQRSNTGGLV